MSEVCEAFAIKYGQRVGQRGGMLIYGDPHDAPMPMDYFIWAVRSPTRTIVVDIGYSYENMERGEPFTVIDSVTDMLEGHRKLYRLADSAQHVVPGHDPLVMQCYPAPSPELQGIAVRLDVAPTQPAVT